MDTQTSTYMLQRGQRSEDDDSSLRLDEASTVVSLHERGDGGTYRLTNDPANPYQRKVAVEQQRGDMEIRCRAREIIHGRLEAGAGGGSGPGPYATLLVYDVHLEPIRASERITSAEVEFKFTCSKKASEVPEVVALAPEGWNSSAPSTQDETTTVGGGLNIGAPDTMANVGSSFKLEKTVQRQTCDSASVVGSMWSDNYGKRVKARWRLMENETMRTGVPKFLRCVMVLGRPSKAVFEANITVKANLDWKAAARGYFRFSGKNPTDDPVLFNPTLPPATSRLLPHGLDLDNLGLVDITELVDVRHATPLVPGTSLLR